MTTTVTVKTRGHGANVSGPNGQEFVSPNSERRFNTDDTMSLSIRQETADEAKTREEREAQERIPGQAENDARVQEVPQSRIDEVSGTSNETGADETTQSGDGQSGTAATKRPR